MDIKIIFTIIAATIGIIGNIPYLWNSLFKGTRPHAFTWLIWSITSWVAVAGLWIGGGSIGSIAPTIGAIMATTIFFISLRFGKRDIRKVDVISLVVALSAIFVWLFLDNLLLAVIIVSFVDAVGYIPTLRKSYHEPYTETASSWGLFALSPAFAMLALAEYNLLTMTYLVTIVFLNSTLLVFLLVRRKFVVDTKKPEYNAAMVILVNDQQQILMQQRTADAPKWPGYYAFFGGGIEGDETPVEGLKRELLEEIEYTTDIPKLIHTVDYENDTRYGKNYYFLAQYDVVQELVLHEGQGYAWVDLDNLDEYKIAEHNLKVIKQIKHYIAKTE